jgi:colicin import membrane protein
MFKIISDNPKAFVLAIAVHLLLVAVLSFSMDWNSTHKAPRMNVVNAVMIDDTKLKAKKEKSRKAEEKKRKAEAAKRKKKELEKKHKAEQKRKKKEAEKKRKFEKERKKKETLRKKRETEKKRKAAEVKRKKIEAKKKRKAEQERKRKEEVARQHAEEQRLLQEQMAAEQARMDAVRQQELAREQDRFIALITQRVESKWLKPSGWRPGVSCKVKVRLVPGAGTAQVIDVQMIKSCGNPLFDNSVTTAVYNASPLPFPTDLDLITRMRDLNFIFKPEE